MFIAQAHSFHQQSVLATTLALVAGYTNIIAILTCGHVVSHVSGTTSDLGRGVVYGLGMGPPSIVGVGAVSPIGGQWGVAIFAIFLLTAFLLGAIISGFVTELGRRLRWESIYVLPMVLQALMLTVFAYIIEFHDVHSVATGLNLFLLTGVASLAMGLQNATITRISSGVVRTTHVTGVLTDLGLEIVHVLWWWRDRRHEPRDEPEPPRDRRFWRAVRVHPAAWRLVLLATIVGCFALGAALGTLMFAAQPPLAMFIPVLFLVWLIYQDLIHPIAEVAPSELVGEGGLILPPGVGVYKLQKDSKPNRRGMVHRLPNLLAWADRLPTEILVVILDLNDVTQLDDNAALELRALFARFRKEHRAMVVSGLNADQYDQLRKAGAEDLDPATVCSDLEIAVAHGLNLLEHIEHWKARHASHA